MFNSHNKTKLKGFNPKHKKESAKEFINSKNSGI